MGYLIVLQLRLGAKIENLHAKDSNTFRKRLIHGPHAYQVRYTLAKYITAILKLILEIKKQEDFLYRPFNSPELNI